MLTSVLKPALVLTLLTVPLAACQTATGGAVVGGPVGVAVGGAALDYGYYGYNRPYYGYSNPYGYEPAPRPYRSARQYYNQRYGTYYDVSGRRPATLGYCQRNPGRCM